MTLYTRAIASWQSWRSKRALAASTKRFRKALPEIRRLSAREAHQRARHGRTAKVHAQIKAALHARLRAELEMR